MPSTITSQPWARIRSTFSRVEALLEPTTVTSGLSASIVRFADRDLRLAEPLGRVDDLALEVRVVDDVGVDDPERPDAGGGEVERRGRAEPAGADQQDARVEQFLLPLLADLGDQEVPRVALALRRRERHRGDELVAVPLPAGEAVGEVDGGLVAELVERLRGEGGAGAALAVDDELRLLSGISASTRDSRLLRGTWTAPGRCPSSHSSRGRTSTKSGRSPFSRSACASGVEISSISARACAGARGRSALLSGI